MIMPYGPVSFMPSAAIFCPISDVKSLHIDASWFGISPAFCMLITRYDISRATLDSIQRSASAICVSRFFAPTAIAGCSFANLMMPSSCLRMPTDEPIDDRSKSSVVVPMYQPRFSSPSRLRAGTRTFSKNTSLNVADPAIVISGRTVTPGAFISSRK